jgi:hypothetical protein
VIFSCEISIVSFFKAVDVHPNHLPGCERQEDVRRVNAEGQRGVAALHLEFGVAIPLFTKIILYEKNG